MIDKSFQEVAVNDTIEMYKKGKKRMYKNVHENYPLKSAFLFVILSI